MTQEEVDEIKRQLIEKIIRIKPSTQEQWRELLMMEGL